MALVLLFIFSHLLPDPVSPIYIDKFVFFQEQSLRLELEHQTF